MWGSDFFFSRSPADPTTGKFPPSRMERLPRAPRRIGLVSHLVCTVYAHVITQQSSHEVHLDGLRAVLRCTGGGNRTAPKRTCNGVLLGYIACWQGVPAQKEKQPVKNDLLPNGHRIQAHEKNITLPTCLPSKLSLVLPCQSPSLCTASGFQSKRTISATLNENDPTLQTYAACKFTDFQHTPSADRIGAPCEWGNAPRR